MPASIERLRLQSPRTISGARAAIDPALGRATGQQNVLVRLRSPSVAESGSDNPADQIMRREQIRLEQSAFAERVRRAAPGANVTAGVQTVLNAVVMEVDASAMQRIAADPSVARVSRVVDYQMDLSETVPFITATKLQTVAKLKGKGVKVAVLDSGIDYTHAAFGGAGTTAAYEAAWGTDIDDSRNTTRDGLFPTPRVVEGHDFVGELWPTFGPLAPDNDPIDLEGHGTHVADIIGGATGVAPEVDLYAVKVCSAVSTSCSGVALLQGMEYAADPNGDGSTDDRVDIVNMSLGSNYGQPFDDDLAAAVEGATQIGILTVASAGNSGDKPYVTGTPAAAASALSVAQTAVPSAFLPEYDIVAPANLAGTYSAIFQPWAAPLTSVIQAPMQYGDGAGGNLIGCSAFAPGSLAGKIVLVDRGTCGFSVKISNIAVGGGLIGIIGLVAPGDPFEGGFSGGDPSIPGYMISQADSNRLKSGLPNTVLRFDPNSGVPLVMSMVGSSSRGPSNYYNAIKPEIGAPGASISAVAGSGTGTQAFGGTSGAAPMVSGSAALILDAYPHLKPYEVKARLMNNAERNIATDAVTGRLAEITRIGNGEVRVFDAWADPAAAWDLRTLSGALSFGQVDASGKVNVLSRFVVVRNYSKKPILYKVRSSFRFADDQALGAVKIITPPIVYVPANGSSKVPVIMTIFGEKLRDNAMDSGEEGASPAPLTLNEIDGYLEFDAGKQSKIHLAWHVLPTKSARVVGKPNLTFGPSGEAAVRLVNVGVGTAQNDAYSLLAESPNLPQGGPGEGMPTPDIRAVGINTIPVPAGFCSANPSFLWRFAINTWERQTHLLPVSHIVFLDTNRDGVDDYAVLNRDLSGLETITDGRQLAWALNLATGSASAFFFVEHATNTGNTVLTICGEQIGMNATNLLTTSVNMAVLAQDFYFGGPGDLIENLTVTPLGERYFATEIEDIAGFSNGSMKVQDFGPWPGNTEELGVLLFTNGDRGAGNRGGATKGTEALQFRVTP
jgi:subtilisin family serine protease